MDPKVVFENWKAIAAVSENGVIGNAGSIPWQIPEEMAWFKETTMGGRVVMGRRTWESINRPLPGRRMIVLSSEDLDLPAGVERAIGLSSVAVLEEKTPIWIAGGTQVYKEALPNCSELLLTRIKREVEGDAYFPEFESLFELHGIIREEEDFQIQRWKRR